MNDDGKICAGRLRQNTDLLTFISGFSALNFACNHLDRALRTVLPITRFFPYRRLFYSILIAIETSCFRGLLLDVCSKNKLLFFAS